MNITLSLLDKTVQNNAYQLTQIDTVGDVIVASIINSFVINDKIYSGISLSVFKDSKPAEFSINVVDSVSNRTVISGVRYCSLAKFNGFFESADLNIEISDVKTKLF